MDEDWVKTVDYFARSLVLRPERLYDQYQVHVGTVLVDVTDHVYERARVMGWSG